LFGKKTESTQLRFIVGNINSNNSLSILLNIVLFWLLFLLTSKLTASLKVRF